MSPARVLPRMLSWICGAGCLAGWLGGCQSFPDPPVSFVAGLRVLGIKAEPPQLAPGDSTTVTTLAVDTNGGTLTASWSQCLLPPLPGQAVNPSCADGSSPSELQPVGDGLSIPFVMPQVTAAQLGAPDVTNGIYLPLVATIGADAQTLTAVYRVRLGDAAPPNTNPTIAGLFSVDAAGVMTALDETAPTPVHSGEALTLTMTFTPDSAQTYTAVDGTVTTETLTTSWFCTAGELSFEKTSATQPQTVLHLDQRLPAVGAQIDLYAVGRDERGGTDFAHRTLLLQ
jgi:hypothetical protein